MQQEQKIPGCQPQEAEQEQINIAGLFDAYLSSEYFLNHYKKSSQILYRQYLRRFLKLSDLIGQLEADQLPKIIDEYIKTDKSPATLNAISALGSATVWGIEQGLLDRNQDVKFRPQKGSDRSPFMDRNVSPLLNEDLRKLMQAVDKKPRDRALILTILLTRANIDAVRELTTGSIAKDENGTTTIAVNDFKIKVQGKAAPVLLNYAQSLKPGPLFPNHWVQQESITRQAMHLILQKYRKKIGLSNLSHEILVKTGVHIFGKPPQPVRQH